MKKNIKLLLLAALAWLGAVAAVAESLVSPPDGLQSESWKLVSAWYKNTNTIDHPVFDGTIGFGRNAVDVIITGNTMYIKGLSQAMPDSWVMGTIDGTTVTFAKNQWLGESQNGAPHFLVGEGAVEGTAVDVKMVYDANYKILTMHEDSPYVLDCDRVDGLRVQATQSGTDSEWTLSSWAYHEGLEIYQPAQKQMKTLTKNEASVITYTWPITSSDEVNRAAGREASVIESVVVTDDESAGRAIALLRKVYMDKRFPGPFSRGHTTAGVEEGTVSYAAVGAITRSGNNYNYSDAYGWAIKNVNPITNSNNYRRFDPTDYKPNDEGYTMLLVEVQDEFQAAEIWNRNDYSVINTDNYQNLVEYVRRTVKKVTLVTEAMRTGTNKTSGTLFKLDADKLNRFFLISKGQLRYRQNSGNEEPYFYNYYDYYGNYVDNDKEPIFYHMFEEFSPSAASQGEAKTDIYKSLVTGNPSTGKTGFSVFHDCSTVPYAEANSGKGHEFQMLANGEDISNAPNVRDLLFFVPDHRMMSHSNTLFPDNKRYSRDPNNNQKFVYYNQTYAPTMDMYVIHLNPIDGYQIKKEGVEQHVYQLNLNWQSNLSDYLPGTEQVYTLYRIVTDAEGSSEYQVVYKTDIDGDYVDASGNKLADQDDVSARVPVTMQGIFGSYTLDYADHVKMDPTGKEVTYAVRGQDTGQFLSLQTSNAESYLIPGYDKEVRLTLSVKSDNYSNFDHINDRNNYWNELIVNNNVGTSVTANFLEQGTVINFVRHKLSIAASEAQGDSVVFAKATVRSKDVANGTIVVDMSYFEQENFTGSRMGDNVTQFMLRFDAGKQEGTVDFGKFVLYDNFYVSTAENTHPNRYVYRAFFYAAEKFDLDPDGDGVVRQSNRVYSNNRDIKVFKTQPSVTAGFALADVLGDDDHSLSLPESYGYNIEVERSPLSELWRYQVCRWDATGDIPSTFDIYGFAQNHEMTYSTSFGTGGNEVTSNFALANTHVAEFEDKALKQDGGLVGYVPRAVVYTKRTDNNTYGAPRVMNAVGKLDVIPYYPTETDEPEMALMSNYKWITDGKWYSYYNIFLNFKAFDVPAGYEPYKVRAWRKVNESVLGEELDTRAGRATGDWYMYEDMNFGDPMDTRENPTTMSFAKLKEDNFLGNRSSKIDKPTNPDGTGGGRLFEEQSGQTATGQSLEEAINGETRATFGALRLHTNELPTDFKTLEAEFLVRVYFTKGTNPLIAGKTDHAPIYVLGNSANSTSWDPSAPLGTLYSYDGNTYVGNVTVNDTNDGNDAGYGFLSFATKIGTWDEVNQGSRFGWTFRENYPVGESDFGKELNLTYESSIEGPGNFRIAAGTYNLAVKMENGLAKKLVITKGAANAPRRAAAMLGDDFDYYIAEGTAKFEFTSTGNVITGITGVKADLNREVESVNYVNTVGQVSDRPWQGVNVVVTRYTDGTTKTTKAVY